MEKASVLKKLDERKKMFEDYLRKTKESARSTRGTEALAVGQKKQRVRGLLKKGH